MAFTNESHNLDLNAVTDLICWCKQLGIKYITLYDDLGKLKGNQKDLFRCLDYKASLLDGNNNHPLTKTNGNGYTRPRANGTPSESINYIKGLTILSKQEGRQKFVRDIKNLLTVEPDRIDIELVQKHIGWTSDPEMLVTFGTKQCLFGFPPWQLRLTEIFSLPSHRNITYKTFIDCLEKYSRTTQRLGA
ncbi:dehydrodolichyl diphosphate synthase complex subunit nus1 [Olea europaea subsp. europaea]|uniref:ditrans,polycis-polyprenyl diphosphate synthase [(2E,6E)-farnesyldiphosphate specific] n=1 Tax=Olea europaea subsp. europaea TaxID=158383 RepID=A0A8S0TNY1_OLEEU|nr:dehydrodolichyl diphosphate synthase complex subunit nus1 [Olea europaea subsp. europaea]